MARTASLPSTRRSETWKDDGIKPPRGVVEKVVRKGIEPKSQAAIVFTGAFPFDSPHEVTLEALGIILENRLRLSLREALRGTYGVDVQTRDTKIPEPRYSVVIQFGCDPDRTEELVARLFREVERLAREQARSLSEMSDQELDDLWNAAKRHGRPNTAGRASQGLGVAPLLAARPDVDELQIEHIGLAQGRHRAEHHLLGRGNAGF